MVIHAVATSWPESYDTIRLPLFNRPITLRVMNNTMIKYINTSHSPTRHSHLLTSPPLPTPNINKIRTSRLPNPQNNPQKPHTSTKHPKPPNLKQNVPIPHNHLPLQPHPRPPPRTLPPPPTLRHVPRPHRTNQRPRLRARRHPHEQPQPAPPARLPNPRGPYPAKLPLVVRPRERERGPDCGFAAAAGGVFGGRDRGAGGGGCEGEGAERGVLLGFVLGGDGGYGEGGAEEEGAF